MTKDNERVVETVRFLKWTKKHPDWWQLICTAHYEYMNFDMMQMLIKKLAEEHFYEIIFVLIEVHKDEAFIKDVNNALLNDLIIDKWEKGHKDDIIEKLIYYLE